MQSKARQKAIAALKKDPAISQMAFDVLAGGVTQDFINTMRFRTVCNERYRYLTGKTSATIGAVAEAVIWRVNDLCGKQVFTI